jgi:hypothetical protein
MKTNQLQEDNGLVATHLVATDVLYRRVLEQS